MTLTISPTETAAGQTPAGDAAPFSLSIEDIGRALTDKLSAQTPTGAHGALDFDPKTVERDLTRLVLTLVEFVRQLLEAQAVRRMEAGRLTPDQEEELGDTLFRARERLLEVAAEFGLSEADLTLELGPLGRLV